MAKGKHLDSPMEVHLGGKDMANKAADHGGTFDKNPTPVLSHPRDKGKGVAPEKFMESLKGSPGALDSPFGTSLPNPEKMKGK